MTGQMAKAEGVDNISQDRLCNMICDLFSTWDFYHFDQNKHKLISYKHTFFESCLAKN